MKKALLVLLCSCLTLQAMEQKTEIQTELSDLHNDWSFNITARELEDGICQCKDHSKRIATFIEIIDKIKSIHELSACTTLEHILPAYKITDKTISDFTTKITKHHKILQESYNDTIKYLHDLHKELTKTQNTLSAIRSGKQYDNGFDELYKIYTAQITDQKDPITLSNLIQNFDKEIQNIDPLVSELYKNLIQFLDNQFASLQNLLNKKLSDTCYTYESDVNASFPDINNVQLFMNELTQLETAIKTLSPLIIDRIISLTTLMRSQHGDHIKTGSKPTQQKIETFINHVSVFKTHMIHEWLNKSDKETGPKVVKMCNEIRDYFLSLNQRYDIELLPMRIEQSRTLMTNLRGLINIFAQSKQLLDIHYSDFLETDKQNIENLLNLLNGHMRQLLPNITTLGKLTKEAQQLIGKHFCPVCHKEATSSCSKCKKTFYCSKNCQTIHWKAHKLFCSKYAPLYFTAHVDGNDIRYCTDDRTPLIPTSQKLHETTFSLQKQAYCIDISDAFGLPVLIKMGDCAPYPIYYDTESAKKILTDDPYKYNTSQKQNILLSHVIHENMHQETNPAH